jgi:hypothetical protein
VFPFDNASWSLLSKIVEHEIQERVHSEALTISQKKLDRTKYGHLERQRNSWLNNITEEIRQNKIWAFEEAKKLMAGVVFNGHGCHLDKTVLQKN